MAEVVVDPRVVRVIVRGEDTVFDQRSLAYAMDFATSVTILYCCYAALRTSLAWVNIGPRSAVFTLVFSVGTPVLVIATTVGSELVFGAFAFG